MIYNETLLDTCDKLSERCIDVGGRPYPSSSFLYNEFMRGFEHPAVISITVPIYIHEAPDIKFVAVVNRDGSFIMRRPTDEDMV